MDTLVNNQNIKYQKSLATNKFVSALFLENDNKNTNKRAFVFILSFSILLVLSFFVVLHYAKSGSEERISELLDLRNFYSKTLSSASVNQKDLKTTPHLKGDSDGLLIPASFMIQFGKVLESDGHAVKVYSPFPFASRPSQPLDKTSAAIWDHLSQQPDEPVSRLDWTNGQLIFRYAEADTFKSETCVACHNTHPSSVKRDWVLGDTRGVVEARVDIGGKLLIAVLAAFALALLNTIGFSLIQRVSRLVSEADIAAHQDPLSGVGNRRSFDRELAHRISLDDNGTTEPLHMMVCDIDNFKSVNDRFGHGVGDLVIASVARAISDQIRDNDSVFRIGGEEFAVLVGGIPERSVMAIAERVRSAVENLNVLADRDESVSISVGVTERNTGEDTDSFYERADKFLYHAKQTGKNKVVYG